MKLLPDADGPQTPYSIKWLTPAGVQTVTSEEFRGDVKAQCKSLQALGLRAGDKVGLRGDNSYLWMVADIAMVELDLVSVVFPNEFNDSPIPALMEEYGLKFFLVSDAGPDASPLPSHTAVLGDLDPARHRLRDVQTDPYPVADDDLSFVFSSGTSGSFKGMVISKRGVLDQVESFGDAMDFGRHDCVLLYMPFSSLQNRVLYYGAVMRGVEITAVPSTQLIDGLKRFNPTILIAPPIFYEAIEKSIKASLRTQSKPTKLILSGLGQAIRVIRALAGSAAANRLSKRLYGAAHKIFGSRMRLMITGMAKIGPSTLEFYRDLGLPLVQVYGLTECGVVCANTLRDNVIGTVGKPLAGNTIEISQDGEIAVRKAAPQTSRFFHFEPSAEDTRFEGDTVYTGDLGTLDADGRLTLVGRKKSTIVAHSGVKVQPELIEKRLEEHDEIAKAVLLSLNGGRTLGVVLQLAETQALGLPTALRNSTGAIVENMAPAFKNHIQIVGTNEEFTAENGLLTRNLKINRNEVRARFFSQPEAA